VNDSLFEELLHEDEGSALDFNRDQYPFAGASDNEKSELLKDILALANAWRRTVGYILIGVDEVKGGRSILVGVAHHLNDNDLQQFVNSKTNRPLTFSYRAYSFEGVSVGIVEVPLQTRPFYLKTRFGRLAAATAYLRRGSATATADLEEVARMGAADAGSTTAPASFELEWANLDAQTALGTSVKVESLVLNPKLSVHALMPRSNNFGIMANVASSWHEPGESYYRELVTYAYDLGFLTPLGFCVRTTSGAAAIDVLAKARIEKVSGIRVTDREGRPVKSSKDSYMRAISNLRPLAQRLRNDPDPIVAEFPTHWELTIPFGRVLPRATLWSTDLVYVGSDRSTTIEFPMQIFAENLPAPQAVDLRVEVAATVRPMVHADV
jgi:hypothetical protein